MKMGLKIGIVGLPNVGKSTLFNALLGKQQALAANYPFATIEPNIGIVPVPDERLEILVDVITKRDFSTSLGMTGTTFGKTWEKPPVVPATVEFIDIAGLVKGAASGEGLGNKFLASIREVDLICHVLRYFEDGEILREGATEPTSDYNVVVAELILKDLETVQKQEGVVKKMGGEWIAFWRRLLDHLNEGKLAKSLAMAGKELEYVESLFLLTMKDEVGVVNISEGQMLEGNKIEEELGKSLGMPIVALNAKLESELAGLGKEAARELLSEYEISESGLDRLIRLAYGKLGLMSFLTAGEKEVRAWTVKKGAKAPNAAGVIHTDFEKKFIKAKVCDYDDFVELNGWKGCAEKGKMRLEGKEYVMKEGDIVEFMIGT